MSSERATFNKGRLQEERELLRLLLEKESIRSDGWEARPAESQERLPLSYAQSRLWFLDRLQPRSSSYNVVLALELEGDLDITALEQSLQEIIRRHGALRTRFVAEDGEPVQKIEAAVEFRLELVDCDNREGDEERGRRAAKIIAREEAEPFDLGNAPLLRGVVIRLGRLEHILCLTIHHIVVDEWSLGVVEQEMGLLYAAHVQGLESPLKELPVQYADFTQWQSRLLNGDVFVRQMEYWKKQLAGMPEVLQLPTDKPRPATARHRGSIESSRAIRAELWQKMKWFSRQEGASPFMALLAIFEVLLLRYTSQTDFGIGIPVTNRSHVRAEGTVGFCLNTLIIRADLADKPTFRSTLESVRQAALGAYEHQELPLEKLVEELSPERRVSGSPLFQVMFTLVTGTASAQELPRLRMRRLPVDTATSKYDLTLIAADEEIPGLAFNYDTDLFEADTIRRMLGHYERLLECAVTDPQLAILDLPMLTGDETRQLLLVWNRTEAEYRQACGHELIEEQARQAPQAVAAEFEKQALTYCELNRQANRLANYLIRLGVGPETRVGICLERSLEMVIGLLGIMKAGAAYVPLEPAYPAERLAYMLEDANAQVVVTREKLIQVLQAHRGKVVKMDTDWAQISVESGENPGVLLEPTNLAYVIYTSGSTGRPKGAMNTHGGLTNRLQWMQREYELKAEERVLQKTPFSFDVSVWEFFWPLLAGARLVLTRPGGHQDVEYLRALIQGREITTLHFVPSMLRTFLETDGEAREGKQKWGSVRRVICSGEALSKDLAQRCMDAAGVEFYNLYGPTEAAIDVTHWRCEPQEVEKRVAIGRPIANLQVYVLDENMMPAAIGIPGELYLAGRGLGRGYVGRPEMTAERWTPNPFSLHGGERFYRTGDQVRWLENGMLEFLGRLDHQVKLRGYRIELGEIEACLREHARIGEAVVIAREGQGGDKGLVAYYTERKSGGAQSGSEGDGEREIQAEELYRHLAQRLPEYMAPAAYVRLETLPLTSSGKLDRRRLPAPDPDASLTTGYEEPQGEMETMLAAVWGQVLERQKVGRNDHFFEQGGHSLLAAVMAARVRQALGLELAVNDIFAHPRLSDLARTMDGAGRVQLPPIPRTGREKHPALSYSQQRLWFIAQIEGAKEAYHVSFGARLLGKLDRNALGRSLDRLLARHESLRTTFPILEGEPWQRIAPAEGTAFLLWEHDLRQHADAPAELERLLEMEACTTFDLEAGPLIRGRLIQHGAEEHTFFVTMHHIISDGWSVGVFLNELSALYAAFVQSQTDPLPELPVQYIDYAVWQRKWVDDEVLSEQGEYWKTALAGTPALLELPTDRPRPAQQDYAGDWIETWFDERLTAELKQLSKKHGATLFMTLMAGWSALLGRLSGQQDVVIGTPVANRGQAEIQGLIGFFVNTLALRLDLSGRPRVSELLQRVKRQALAAQRHQDIPYEQVLEIVQPQRSLAHTPLFQVMFAWQNTPAANLNFPGLVMSEPVMPHHRAAQFDLTMALAEIGDRILGGVVFAAALFERATVRRHMGYLRRLLEAMAADGDPAVDCLMFLPHEERDQVVSGWNQTAVQYELKCVHELWEDQVRKSPESVAAQGQEWQEQMSYAELNQRANQLGHYLRRVGVGPEVRIGICLERGLPMVVGLLGILKAGGAYVPMDPGYPSERLRFIAEDAGISVLLTQRKWLQRLPRMARVVCLEEEAAEIAQQKRQNLEAASRSGNLAYLIYTSGSTGRPKGVAIEHGSASILLQWARAIFSAEEFAGVFASTSLGFDLSVFEIFAPLSCGGKVIVASNALSLAETGQGPGVRLLNTVPSVMAELLQSKGIPDSIRTVNLAGEALHADLVEALYRKSNVERVLNLYGPSEATTYSTYASLKKGEGRAPIGKPIHNTQAYVLDQERQPVPVDVIGELHLGGQGIARGYLNQPEMTAEKFLPNPFAERGGERMYRTGDQVKWGRDGTLEFLGRLDQQVKVRGYRIELGEIEAVLEAHPGVMACAVIVREDEAGEKRLVAYVVKAGAPEGEDFKDFLKQRLPAYMVPSAFVIVEQLPLTPSGKVDRKALLANEAGWSGPTGYVGPRNGQEEILCGLFAEVLNIDRIGVHDDFFAVGGHSLLATRLASRIQSTLGTKVPLRKIFEFPTVAGLVPLLDRGEKPHPRLAAQTRPQQIPLSYGQQRLWFIHQMEGSSPAYNMTEPLRLRGRLNSQALEQALSQIVARHEVLRTHFAEVDGRPVQVIVHKMPLNLLAEDLSGLSEEVKLQQVRDAVAQENERRFHLEQGPLLYFRLLKLGDQDHVLVRNFHHIVSDAWSHSVFARELTVLYEAFCEGRPDPLSPLPVQYADYALWQRTWLTDAALGRELEYWTEKLAGIPEEFAVPLDGLRPPRQSFTAASCGVKLAASTVESLKKLGRAGHATPYMTLLAMFAVLLQRYSGEADIVIGSPIANRLDAQLEQLLGFFVNSLVMRVQVEPEKSFADLLQSVRRTTLEAYAHQDLPFERLVEKLSPRRSLNVPPLFQVMFAFQNAPSTEQRLKDLTIEVMTDDSLTVRVDLEVHAVERDGQIELDWVYNRDLFARWRIEQMCRHFEQFLLAAVSMPLAPVYLMPMLAEHETQQLLLEWNRTERPHPAEETIHALFEQQATRTPEAIAVHAGPRSLTYRELNRRANQLAHYLKELGAGPEVKAAICLERGVEMFVGLMGVLKAGGTYVPLDPKYPDERLSYMVKDSGAGMVLTQGAMQSQYAGFGVPIVRMDEQWNEIAARSYEDSEVKVNGANLAYVIYTSGSTGKPKGVAISHGGAANFVHWCVEAFTAEDLSGVLFSTSICFDISVFEIFAPLACGGSVVVAENALELPTLANVDQVKFLDTVPSALRELARMKAIPSSVQAINSGGEALTEAVLCEIFENSKVQRFRNLYGPTEATICSTYASLARGEAGTPAIGKPIANTQVYVLDRWLEPVPVGVLGDLYIAGTGLARGYLGRPEFTGDRFIPDPFSTSPGRRMYATGDRVKWTVDGNLEFLGRADGQVKIRGFRIELGEIESALHEHSQVQEAAVIALNGRGEEKQLAAYVVASEGTSLNAVQLRERFKTRLPEHMIPVHFVFLERLPRNQSGKVDRKALPQPQAPLGNLYVAPQTAMEQLLAAVWEEVLGLERVGLDDNFFDLGGHSLLVARVRFSLRQKLQREIALVDFFSCPTVRLLAERLEHGEAKPLSAVESQERASRQRASLLRFRQQRSQTER